MVPSSIEPSKDILRNQLKNCTRVAIVHPFLVQQGGGEKVVDALARLFPDAEIFTLMCDRSRLSDTLQNRQINVTKLDNFPGAARFYQFLSPFYDWATSQHDLSGFDLVISTGGPGAKTVSVPESTPHIHYCHSPVRFLWDQYETWMKRLPFVLRLLFALSVRYQRQRDYSAAQKVSLFISNSDYIGERIARYYGRSSKTVYPPVALSETSPAIVPEDYYLTVGRLVPNKRTELLIEACNRLGRRLMIVGDGPKLNELKAMAGPSVTMCGRVSDERLDALYRRARAFVFAADEDFGIATVEAQSYGLPVIAYGHGGTLEIVKEMNNDGTGDGIFFSEQTPEGVIEGLRQFEDFDGGFDRSAIQKRAARFSEERFAEKFMQIVAHTLVDPEN